MDVEFSVTFLGHFSDVITRPSTNAMKEIMENVKYQKQIELHASIVG